MTQADTDALLAVCMEFDRLALVIASAVTTDDRSTAKSQHRAVMDALQANIAMLHKLVPTERFVQLVPVPKPEETPS